MGCIRRFISHFGDTTKIRERAADRLVVVLESVGRTVQLTQPATSWQYRKRSI